MKENISLTAKMLYGLLFNRSMLSQHNNWLSPEGNVFIVYTIPQMAEDLNCGKTAIKSALNELQEKKLIIRKRQGYNEANHIFVLLPESANSDRTEVGKRPSQGSESGLCIGRNPAPSETDTSYTETSKTEVVNIRKAYGSFNNVFLSDAELERLNELYPAEHQFYIEKLSSYMQRSGRSYGNHYDTILKWLREDIKSYDYSYEEGECL